MSEAELYVRHSPHRGITPGVADLERSRTYVPCGYIFDSDDVQHIIGDVREQLGGGPRNDPHGHWDLMIAHPECTYLSVSGLHWNKRGRMVDGRQRAELTEEALAFAWLLLGAPIRRIALENPVGCISTRFRRPDQIIQPYQFGDDASKRTCLWLKNLPPLHPTKYVEPRMVNGNPRWANQTDSGQNKLAPSDDRAILRSLTYPGIADAMAKQWGALGVGKPL